MLIPFFLRKKEKSYSFIVQFDFVVLLPVLLLNLFLNIF